MLTTAMEPVGLLCYVPEIRPNSAAFCRFGDASRLKRSRDVAYTVVLAKGSGERLPFGGRPVRDEA